MPLVSRSRRIRRRGLAPTGPPTFSDASDAYGYNLFIFVDNRQHQQQQKIDNVMTSLIISPFGKLADRGIYFTFRNFFLF